MHRTATARWGLCVAALTALTDCAAIRPRDVATPTFEGCAPPRSARAQPGRFAIVADSQFNTQHASRRSFYRRRFADRIHDVAIRPPALDATSHYLLRSILEQQIEAGAEVVFYLGDGANNGCQDELVGRRQVDGIDGALTVLRQTRARFGVPIFFVLGNHDYLGAGNTSAFISTRNALCNTTRDGDNAPLTKFAVMALVHEFNRESAALGERWTLVDSWDRERIGRACNAGEHPRPRNQHMRRGCYLASHVFDAVTRREYLLVDSNDYADTLVGMLSAGRRGGVSFRGRAPQTAWLKAAGRADAEARVVLSHYDVATINAANERALRRLRPLIRPGRTVWLSAHTHEPTVTRHEHRARRSGFTETNVGSGTDYPAYGLYAELAHDPIRGAELVRATEVFAAAPERCTPVLAEMSRAVAGSDYFPFRRHTRGLGLFGLDILVDWAFVDKEYRHRTWTRADDQHVRENVRAWLDRHAPWPDAPASCGWPSAERLEIGACIGMYSSLQEGAKAGWAPIVCDDCRDDTSSRPREIRETKVR